MPQGVLLGTANVAELLQVQRQCSDTAAAAEVRDVPWHLLHECPTGGGEG